MITEATIAQIVTVEWLLSLTIDTATIAERLWIWRTNNGYVATLPKLWGKMINFKENIFVLN